MSSRWNERARRVLAGAAVFMAAAVATAVLGSDAGGGRDRWTFLDDTSLAELGLVTHGARSGAWRLEDHPPATGGRALANHEGEPGASPAILVAASPRSRDLRAKTRCKVVGRSSAAACGVVFRFVDDQNHWLVRADAKGGAIEAATVIGGRELVVRRAPIPSEVAREQWIDLDVEVRGDVVRVALAGKPALVAEAPSVPAAFGAVGLWAPSEAKVFFDHFAIESLSPAPRALEILPLLGRRPG